ncbi:hypothetical protein N9924_00300 [bacterium]|nr:hypothetical protein [bacterium]
MLGILIPTEDEVEVEEDLTEIFVALFLITAQIRSEMRALHLSKDWCNDPRDENGEVTY